LKARAASSIGRSSASPPYSLGRTCAGAVGSGWWPGCVCGYGCGCGWWVVGEGMWGRGCVGGADAEAACQECNWLQDEVTELWVAAWCALPPAQWGSPGQSRTLRGRVESGRAAGLVMLRMLSAAASNKSMVRGWPSCTEPNESHRFLLNSFIAPTTAPGHTTGHSPLLSNPCTPRTSIPPGLWKTHVWRHTGPELREVLWVDHFDLVASHLITSLRMAAWALE
jgi:hypothetical protein